MRRVEYTRFGGPEVLEIVERTVPSSVLANEVLVQVKAVSLNAMDWKFYGGHLAMLAGKKFPKGVGGDFAGVITLIGSGVSEFKAGKTILYCITSAFKLFVFYY